MTTREICKLMVSLDIKPWCSEPREYEIARQSLSSLDEYTLKFQDQRQFYEAIRGELIQKVNKDSISEVGLVPIEVTLSKNGVFVRTKEKDIRALFQNIDFKNQAYSLNDLALLGMARGGLKKFYECDKRRSSNPHYQSFFKDKLKYVGKSLEIEEVKETDYNYVLNELMTRKRYSEVVRFLLRFLSKSMIEEDYDSIYEFYLRDVEDLDYSPLLNEEEETQTKTKRYYYRYPYKED